VLGVLGEIDLSNAHTFGDTLMGTIRHGRPLVVDLSVLRYIDSVGLHILLRAHQRAQHVESKLVFVAPPRVRHFMETVGLDRLVPVFPDVETALQTLKTAKSP